MIEKICKACTNTKSIRDAAEAEPDVARIEAVIGALVDGNEVVHHHSHMSEA